VDLEVDEALARSKLVVSRLGPSSFNMPWLNGRADLLGSLLLQGDLGRVERDWPGAWDDAVASDAWEHWLIMGRLAAYRADLELQAGRLDDAVTWARRAIEGARTGMRPKYEAIALTTLGKALTLSGVDAAAELAGDEVFVTSASHARSIAGAADHRRAQWWPLLLQLLSWHVRRVAGRIVPAGIRPGVGGLAPVGWQTLGSPARVWVAPSRGGVLVRLRLANPTTARHRSCGSHCRGLAES
jgi:hypothetical protein